MTLLVLLALQDQNYWRELLLEKTGVTQQLSMCVYSYWRDCSTSVAFRNGRTWVLFGELIADFHYYSDLPPVIIIIPNDNLVWIFPNKFQLTLLLLFVIVDPLLFGPCWWLFWWKPIDDHCWLFFLNGWLLTLVGILVTENGAGNDDEPYMLRARCLVNGQHYTTDPLD